MQKQVMHKNQFIQEEYEEIEEIGRGCFGTVHKIRRKSDGRIFVWKKICYENMTQQEKIQIVNEVNVLRKLNHRNIIKYIDRIIDKQNQQIYIVMEYCDEGDLGNILKKKKKLGLSIVEEDVISIFIQLLDALNYCHTRNNRVLHRDIKPQNIFMIASSSSELVNKIQQGSRINRDFGKLEQKTAIVKLGDFGLARYLSGRNQLATTHVGTPYYMSPEVLGKGEYDEKSDIWSLGCCIYEILAGRPPFYARSYDELRKYVKDGIVPDLPKCYSSELNSVLKLMFERDPHKRPSAEEIFNLDFIKYKTLRLSSKLDLYFLMYEYQKILSYNHYLESLLKSDKTSGKKITSDESALDASIDSSASTGIACSNNENASQNTVQSFSQEYRRLSNQGVVSRKIERTENSLGKENEKLSYITPKRKTSMYNFGLQDVPGSADIFCKSNSKACTHSPVTAPTRLNGHKDNYYPKNQNAPDPKDQNFYHVRRPSITENERNVEESIQTPACSGISSNSSNSSINESRVKRSTTAFKKGDDIIFESEQRLSRWIQRFHSRNKSSI
ncbi:kinase domain-containing [Cryptosporidium sp. chipmunk genotype I]|uniref:kinase domain-containing n=1 Tax=Cryptosporidium sp. chipmunk genotype I TaxID=1280935 RepID=UPI00351A68F5|nr:kinase domain-containing [Cryptosporidium sp. chipmunk genotype I]